MNSFIIHKNVPVFNGHFINNPVIPGVTILEQVINLWTSEQKVKVVSFEYATFISPLKPKTLCKISYEAAKSPKKINFIIKNDQIIISKGRFIHE